MGDTTPTSDVGIDQMINAIALYPAAVKVALINSEDRLIDVVAQVSSNQAQIRELKRGTTAEVSDGDQGRDWFVVVHRTAKRSYNTQALLGKLTPKDGTIASTLQFLLQTGVIKLTWNWKPLKSLARKEGLRLSIIDHEIEDGDPEYDVGEWWKDGYPRYQPIEMEKPAL